MSNKRPPKELQQRRKHNAAAVVSTLGGGMDWKFWIVGFGGLVLTTVLALIALWLTAKDRPTVSISAPRDPNDVMTSVLELNNSGVLPLREVFLDVYIKEFEFGPIKGEGQLFRQPIIPILQTDEPIELELRHLFRSTAKYTKCDFAIAAHFRPGWAPFWHRTRIFRFRTEVERDGGNRIHQVPAADIEAEYLGALKATDPKDLR